MRSGSSGDRAASGVLGTDAEPECARRFTWPGGPRAARRGGSCSAGCAVGLLHRRCADAGPFRHHQLDRGRRHPSALLRQRPAQVGRRRAVELCRSRHRRVEIPELRRLAQGQDQRRLLRLHQGDRGRRPRRRPLRRALAQGEGRRRAARRLSFLLLLPPGRRAGALVHRQRAQGKRRPAAGPRHGMESAVADLQAAGPTRPPCAARCASSCRSSRSTTARSRSSTPRSISSTTTACPASAAIPTGCARSPAIRRRNMAATPSPSGSTPARASFPASGATPTSTSSTAT